MGFQVRRAVQVEKIWLGTAGKRPLPLPRRSLEMFRALEGLEVEGTMISCSSSTATTSLLDLSDGAKAPKAFISESLQAFRHSPTCLV